MLQFEVFHRPVSAKGMDLSGSYLFGQDDVPLRADLAGEDCTITCTKSAPGPCGLAILWDAGRSGRFLLGTTRLPERSQPYNLNLELARAQIVRLYRKQEDWGLLDYADAKDLNEEFNQVRAIFIEAVATDVTDPAAAAVPADKSLEKALLLGEKFTLFHADAMNNRRAVNGAGCLTLGCRVDLGTNDETYQDQLREVFDFIRLPTPWTHVEPMEHIYDFTHIDAWCNWAARQNMPLHAGPLLSFAPSQMPDWLRFWKGDFGGLRRVILTHIQKVVERYARGVRVWCVVSGLNAVNAFNLSFNQITDLTRQACTLVKRLAPQSQVLIDLAAPWGEYYARNQRTTPPLLYADIASQCDLRFDALGLPLQMGVPVNGYYVRDLMQISSLLDELMMQDKKLHITACGVPSSVRSDPLDAWGGTEPIAEAGKWRGSWSPKLQAEWLEAVFQIARSKPHVESLCCADLADIPGQVIPHGGLCRLNMQPKASYEKLRNFRTAAGAAGLSRTWPGKQGNQT